MRAWCFVLLIGCAEPVVLEPAGTSLAAAPTPKTWRPITNAPPVGLVAPVLLTDGTVMVQEDSTVNWWRLTPDEFGSYADGTWSKLAAMPTGYTPLYTATGVLPDGRVIVEGGEYIDGVTVWTTRGAIYDPIANQWTNVLPPEGWTTIGDASGMVLPDGRFLLSNCCTPELALFQPSSLGWTPFGSDKRDINDEESWAQLWDGTILTVDANNLTDLTQAELLDPKTGQWTSAGETPVKIADTNADNSGSHEVGPEILMPNGDVLALGGNGHNVYYHTATQTWTLLPDLPKASGQQLAIADGPGAMMPNGTALFAAAPGVDANGNFGMGTHFYESDGATFTQVDEPPNAKFASSFSNFLIVLPSGEVMLTDFSTDVELYTPTPGVTETAVPVITAAPSAVGDFAQPLTATPVSTLIAGQTYHLEADRINGISQGAYYGDDLQSYTNYPVIRITNDATGHVRYCRTHHHGNRSIGPASKGTTQFDVPADLERGTGKLETVANGIASPAIEINVR